MAIFLETKRLIYSRHFAENKKMNQAETIASNVKQLRRPAARPRDPEKAIKTWIPRIKRGTTPGSRV